MFLLPGGKKNTRQRLGHFRGKRGAIRNKTGRIFVMAYGRRRAMQQKSSEGRTIKAANSAKVSTYTPSLISLKGSYVAMIFRRPLCRNPLDVRKK